MGNYVPTVLAERYDAFGYVDRTEALTPLCPAPAPGGEGQAWHAGL